MDEALGVIWGLEAPAGGEEGFKDAESGELSLFPLRSQRAAVKHQSGLILPIGRLCRLIYGEEYFN